jgi:hypothetical protein
VDTLLTFVVAALFNPFTLVFVLRLIGKRRGEARPWLWAIKVYFVAGLVISFGGFLIGLIVGAVS